jgi:GNAT superfamily N-acetyltransferase
MRGEGGIILEWETRGYAAFLEEAAPLISDHWEEVGSFREVLSLNPMHDAYIRLEKGGHFHILVARNEERMVGYFTLIIIPHPRDQTKLLGKEDAIYVKPEYRGSLIGYKMMKMGVDRMLEEGVSIAMYHEKSHWQRVGVTGTKSFLERLGFEPHEIVYAKVLK